MNACEAFDTAPPPPPPLLVLCSADFNAPCAHKPWQTLENGNFERLAFKSARVFVQGARVIIAGEEEEGEAATTTTTTTRMVKQQMLSLLTPPIVSPPLPRPWMCPNEKRTKVLFSVASGCSTSAHTHIHIHTQVRIARQDGIPKSVASGVDEIITSTYQIIALQIRKSKYACVYKLCSVRMR